MIALGCFSEMKCFADNGSINAYIVDKVNYDKKKVIGYLSSNKRIAGCPREAIDCITGKKISDSFSVFTDGEYEWCDFLEYYIERYSIKLPNEFIRKINAEYPANK